MGPVGIHRDSKMGLISDLRHPKEFQKRIGVLSQKDFEEASENLRDAWRQMYMKSMYLFSEWRRGKSEERVIFLLLHHA